MKLRLRCTSIEVWLSKLRNIIGIIEFRFYNDHHVLVAEGNQKGVFIDAETMKPRRLLPAERELFTPFLETRNDVQS